MNKSEAEKVLKHYMDQYREKPYGKLVTLMGNVQVYEVKGSSGAQYTLEFDVMWDGKTKDDIRVIGAIDDGTLRNAFSPLSDDFILTPDGRFVGE